MNRSIETRERMRRERRRLDREAVGRKEQRMRDDEAHLILTFDDALKAIDDWDELTRRLAP
jgi:hypothetical protein